MEDLEQQEPIFQLATECEVLYATQISRLNDDGDPNAAKLLSDVYQRFSAWAAFLGVFAETNVCLDRRLRRHIEIQDQVLRLLDIMQMNLSYLFEDGDSPDSGNNTGPTENQSATVNIKSLDAISGALERLNQLGTAIRRSSVTSQISKAREFAANFDLTSFEQVANILLRTLYSDASDGLIELLTRSMAESYALFLHRKSRQERLGVSRAVPRLHRPLMQIPEEPTNAPDGGDAMGIDLGALRVSDSLTPKAPGARLPPPVYKVPQSEPTSVDSQELKARLRRLMSPSTKSKPVSILVNQAEYPRPAKASLICEWCFGPLMTDFQEKSKWQEHINEDFKPYICLSEKCAESMPRFASSRQWLEHMVTTHGENWHREVHAPASWVCPLCTEFEVSFDSPEGLSAHFDDCHAGIFKEQQMKAIVRQSLFRVPRSKETCPLCHFPIGEENAPQANQEGTAESNQQGKHYTAKPGDSESKRLKTDTGYTKMSDHADADVDIKITPIADSEFKDKSISRNRLGVQVIGSHVAAHLQLVMLLTLRLISIDGAEDDSAGSQCGSSEIDDQASWVSSGPRGFDQEMSDTGLDLSSQPDDNIDPDTETHSTENVPDSEPISWDDVLGRPSNMSEDDHVSADVMETSSQPDPVIEREKMTWEHLFPYYNAIKELVHFEYSFARDMKVVDDIYKGTASSCLELSRDDIRIIFRNSGELVQLSWDFQTHLSETTKGVYIIPKSQRRSSGRTGTSHTPFTNDEQPGSQKLTQSDDVYSTFVGQTFMAYTTRMKQVYVEYLKKHDLADERLRALEKNPKVTKWLGECQAWASDLTNARDLRTLLARPIHHMLNYPQILESLLSLTPTDHPDWQDLDAAFKEVTEMSLTVNEAIKQQGLLQNVIRRIQTESNNQTGFLRGLNRRTRKASTFPDTDTKYAALVGRFKEDFLRAQILMRDIVDYTRSFPQSIDAFLETVVAVEGLFDVSQTIFPEQEFKCREVKIAASDIKSVMVPDHLKQVRECVLDPLAELLKLYARPQKLMKSRDDLLPDYSKVMAAKERGEQPGKKTTEQAQTFIALNETLKDELPKLFTLSAKLAQASLRNLVDLEISLFSRVPEKLRPPIGSRTEKQDIVDAWREDFGIAEAQVQMLGICNGSLLADTTITLEPAISSNPPSANASSRTPTVPGLTLNSPLRSGLFRSSVESIPLERPNSGNVESAGADPVDTLSTVLFLAASLFEFTIEEPRSEAGYPYLTYTSGEVFDVLGEKGELWLAKNQDDAAQQVGWIWSKHFAKL